MKTKQGQVLNNLTSAPLQTLIILSKQLRELVQQEPERLGAVAFLNSFGMEAIIKNINAQSRSIKDLLTRLFSEDKISKVLISLEMLLQAWGENGENGSWCRRFGRELTTCFPMS